MSERHLQDILHGQPLPKFFLYNYDIVILHQQLWDHFDKDKCYLQHNDVFNYNMLKIDTPAGQVSIIPLMIGGIEIMWPDGCVRFKRLDKIIQFVLNNFAPIETML